MAHKVRSRPPPVDVRAGTEIADGVSMAASVRKIRSLVCVGRTGTYMLYRSSAWLTFFAGAPLTTGKSADANDVGSLGSART